MKLVVSSKNIDLLLLRPTTSPDKYNYIYCVYDSYDYIYFTMQFIFHRFRPRKKKSFTVVIAVVKTSNCETGICSTVLYLLFLLLLLCVLLLRMMLLSLHSPALGV